LVTRNGADERRCLVSIAHCLLSATGGTLGRRSIW